MRLKELYNSKAVPELMKEFEYKNVMQTPRLEKVVLAVGISSKHKDTNLQECDFIVLPGGFSFGDYLRSGAIAKFSPIMKEIIGFANAGGYVMGICNGFQILCETGLLPGALLHNTNHKFICKNVHSLTLTTSPFPLL